MRLSFLPLAFALAAAAAHGEDVRASAQKIDSEFMKAVNTQDVRWFEKTAAPDFYVMGVDGRTKVSRPDALAAIKGVFASGKLKQARMKVIKVVPSGSGYVETYDFSFVLLMTSPSGKKARLDSANRYEEHWSKEGGVWRLHLQKVLKSKTTIDGKEVG